MSFSIINFEYFVWLIAFISFGWARGFADIPNTSGIDDSTCGFIVPNFEEYTSDESGEALDKILSDSPWHATLYIQRNSSSRTRKDFQCGATIIHKKLLLTAAQCVYDDETRTAIDPGVLFILAGNIHRDYDSTLHDFEIVKKRRVKNVHISCTYHGRAGHYASDIALLELSEPFKFSNLLCPACLDVSGFNEQFLDSGEPGRVVGFGERATKELSEILMVKTVSYVSQDQPPTFSKSGTLHNADLISSDKLCGVNSNGTGVGPGDRGGGLMFKRNGPWCVMGIYSMGIGVETKDGNTSCDMYSYTLYTKVSDHMTWIKNVMFDIEVRGAHSPRGCDSSPFLITTATQTPNVSPAFIRLRTQTSSVTLSSCSAPPQPTNGEWKLHRDSCKGDMDCIVSEGTEIPSGSQLIYSCQSGYRVENESSVYCQVTGEWSTIPNCTEVKCSSLNSVSNSVSCFIRGEWVSCDNMQVVPGTRAVVACLPGYKKDTAFISTRKGEVVCSDNGKWEPDPIRCVPVCGVAITQQKPLVFKGSSANIGDFPWHASLHAQIKTRSENRKVFKCGATIIHTNFLITAAHCVYNELYKTTEDPQNFVVITGNIFRDYDSPLHDLRIVRKGTVKKIYTHCSYYGISGNYASDIALLELHEPFEFSSILSPACLDDSGSTEQFLEPGINGRVAGFGRTESSDTSFLLQTLTVPYISNSQCKVSRNAAENEAFITSDKFCAGYNNGSSLCEGDSGGGLVIRKSDQWHFMGIVSVGLGTDTRSGERKCDVNSYTLFTKVFQYVAWIQDVLYFAGRKKPFPPCREQPSSCVTPPQPANGEWRLHGGSCKDNVGCKISEGTQLPDSSQLDYKCDPGFMTEDTPFVYCKYDGTWTPIPTCKPLPAVFCSETNASLIAGVCTWQKECQLDFRNRIGRDPSDGACQFSGPESICCSITPAQQPVIPGDSGSRRIIGAIAEKKCKEYSRYVYATKCPPVAADDRQSQIIPNNLGKVKAQRTEFPYMVAVGYDSNTDMIFWGCGGTLISEIFVLTAARCTYNRRWGDATWVRLGDLNLVRSDDGAKPLDRRITQRIRNPDFNPEFLYHDVALLRLESRVPFSGWIRPACLHNEPSVNTDEATATGWGALSLNDTKLSADLMKVSLPTVDSLTCNASLNAGNSLPRLPNGIIDDQLICAGAKGKDTCKGDNGGPLAILSTKKYHCMYDVVGITINGPGRCGSGLPGLFTRVYYYMAWIESTVWGQG